MITPPDRDANVIAIVERSALAERARTIMAVIERAAHASRTGRTLRQITGAWRDYSAAERLHAVGTMLIAAVVIHVAVTAVHKLPPGWQWLVVPGIALAQGVVLLIASRRLRATS